jgi:hypothetical protein
LPNVLDGTKCNLDNNNCTVDQCLNGTCQYSGKNICPKPFNKTKAIIASVVAGVAVLFLAIVAAIVAVVRASQTQVFDASTWAAASAGGGTTSPLYTPVGHEGQNPLFAQ